MAMNRLVSIFVTLYFWLSGNGLYSQTIDCSDFSILGFGPDTLTEGNFVLHVRMEGETTDFINYPFISVVLDCNGDTVATGNMNFFGQFGQSVQSYPVTGILSSACLPLTVEFVYGNANLENDTCRLDFIAFPEPVSCPDFLPVSVESDQFNTLVNISMLGSENAFITSPRISFVKDCNGDTIATGFVNYAGQIGQSTIGYAISSISNTICYPLTIEFIFSNTNTNRDTCLLTLDTATGISPSVFMNPPYSVFPNPFNKEITIQIKSGEIGKKYFICSSQGSVLAVGNLLSEKTVVDFSRFSKGPYFLRIEGHSGKTISLLKE